MDWRGGVDSFFLFLEICPSWQSLSHPKHAQNLLPRDIKLLRYIGEQRLIAEEEIDARDGGKARGPFGKIRNPSSQARAQAGQPFRDMRTLGTGVRLFEAVLAPTGERIVLKEFLPIMRNLARSEIECVCVRHIWSRPAIFVLSKDMIDHHHSRQQIKIMQGLPGPVRMGPHQRAGLASHRPARRSPRRLP